MPAKEYVKLLNAGYKALEKLMNPFEDANNYLLPLTLASFYIEEARKIPEGSTQKGFGEKSRDELLVLSTSVVNRYNRLI
jgi:hypothetical protein